MISRLWRYCLKRMNHAVAGKRGAVPPRPSLLCPCLETLEDRTLPSTSIPLNTNSWTPIGPAPINSITPFGNGVVSGRITGIAADPNNVNIIYITAAGGGVWKTIDGGSTWKPLTDNLKDSSGNPIPLFMGAITVDPRNSNILYAGTGEANQSGDSFYGRGILKSTNAGATWTLLDDGGTFERTAVFKIVVDYSNDNNVYVAVGTAVNGVGTNTGIYKSTNGGQSWVNTTASISTIDEYSDLVIDPNTPSLLYTAIGNPNPPPLGTPQGSLPPVGVYKSINAGQTWTLLKAENPNPLIDGRVSLAVASNSYLYVAVADTSFGTLNRFLVTKDTGNTFTALPAPNFLGVAPTGQGFYDNIIATQPGNPNVIYGGGSSNGASFDLIQSTDGGATWNAISQFNNASTISGSPPHTDHHALAFDRNGRLLDGNDGGIWRLNNPTFSGASLNWQDLNGNLQTIQFTGIALHPTTPDIAYGGSQDNGTEQFNDNLGWSQVQGGDGGFTRVDPFDLSLGRSVVYQEFNGISLQVSTNGGLTFNPVGPGLFGNGNFYAPYVLDPNPQTQLGALPNTARVLYGSDRLFQSINEGANWTAIGIPGVNGFNNIFVVNGVTFTIPIDAIAVAPSDPKTIYVTAGGDVFVTRTGTSGASTSWTQTPAPGGFADTFSSIAVDPADPNTAYIVRNAFAGGALFAAGSGGHVFKTTNGGASWTDISTRLPNIPTESIVIDPRGTTATRTLYVGTDTGVYAGTAAGGAWTPFKTGLPNAQVTALELEQYPGVGTVLAAGTHGRGMFEILTQGAVTGQVQLVVTTQPPANVVAGTAFRLIVKAEDSFGTVDTTFNGTVTVSLGNNPGGSKLGGTVSVAAVNGVATFNNLTLNKTGTGYTLISKATGLTQGTTNPFNVIAGAATTLLPSPSLIGPNRTFTINLLAYDALGNLVSQQPTTSTILLTGITKGNYVLTPAAPTALTNSLTFTLLARTLGLIQIRYTATLNYPAALGGTRNLSGTFSIAVSFGNQIRQ